MPLDLNTIKAGVKLQLKNGPNPADANDNAGINTALAFCLDELSDRQQSPAFLRTYDVSVAVNDRTELLTGENADLRFIFAIKYGTGNDQKVLEYVDIEAFLRDYDNPNASAGTPIYWTIVESTDGYPKIKFDVPAAAATTMTVYYHIDINEGTVATMRSGYAIVDGVLAYYYGKATQIGAVYHANFKEGVGLMRGTDKFSSAQVSAIAVDPMVVTTRLLATSLRAKRRG